MAVIDAALNRQLTSPAELRAGLAALARRPGIGTAVNAVAFADGGSESVGESRLRVVLADQGLPVPLLQAKIVAADGEVIARVDFLFPEYRVVVEFDGAAKYGDDGATVVAEKWREDRIRELGYIVVRVSWDDLTRPRLLAERIRAAFALAAKLA